MTGSQIDSGLVQMYNRHSSTLVCAFYMDIINRKCHMHLMKEVYQKTNKQNDKHRAYIGET